MRKAIAWGILIALLGCLLSGSVALAEPKWMSQYRGVVNSVFQNTNNNYYLGLVDIRGKGLPVLMLGRRSGRTFYVEFYYIKSNKSLRKSTHNRITLGYDDAANVEVGYVYSGGKRQTIVRCNDAYTKDGKYRIVDRLWRVTQNSKMVLDVQELFRYEERTGSNTYRYYVGRSKTSASKFRKKYTSFMSKYGYAGQYMQSVDSRSEALSLFEDDLSQY